MIQESTTASVAAYAAALDTAGVALAPLAATPLAALAAGSNAALSCVQANAGDFINLQLSDLSISSNNEQHDGTMTAIVTALAPAIKEHIRIAQTVVK